MAPSMVMMQASSLSTAKTTASRKTHSQKPCSSALPPTRSQLRSTATLRPAAAFRVNCGQQCNSRQGQPGYSSGSFRPGQQRWRGSWGGPGAQVEWNVRTGDATLKVLSELWKEWEKAAQEAQGYSQPSTGRWSQNDGEMRLSVDMEEDDESYSFMADVPGLSRSDIKVQVDSERVLVISGERKRAEAEKEQNQSRRQYERTFGKFSRRIQLPEDTDIQCITARTEDGVLYLNVRKTAESQPSVTEVPIN